VDTSGAATGNATYELKILGVLGRFKNAYGANVVLIVKINNHQLGSFDGYCCYLSQERG
jgi:hypothetical protein